MLQTDLSHYTLAELRTLRHKVDKEITRRRQDDMKEARRRILAIANNVGLSVDELAAGSIGKQARKSVPRYRNPADSSQTWAGHGRQPRWMINALANGKTLDDFRA